MINDQTAWCGVDLSKKTFEAAYHPADVQDAGLWSLPSKSFPRTQAGMQGLYDWIEDQRGPNDQRVRVVMEATGRYSLEVAAWILADRPQHQPAIVNPRQAAAFPVTLGLRNKTDRIDSRCLSKFGKVHNPPVYQPLTPLRQSLQALTRQRTAFLQELTAANNRRQETPTLCFLKKRQDEHIRFLQDAIKRIEKELERLGNTDDRVAYDLKLMQSIPGVGFLTAITVIAELGDLGLFQRSRQLSSMAGLSPQIRDSGTSLKKRPRLSKQGNVHVRAIIFMAAKTAVIHNRHMRTVYQRLRENGKSYKSALGAVMRKLLVLMRSLVIGRNFYDPDWDPKTRVVAPVEKVSKTHPKLRFVPR